MTTVPTAIMPARLERLDSKNMARARHSRSRMVGRKGLALKTDGVMASVKADTDMPCDAVWLQPARANGDSAAHKTKGVSKRLEKNKTTLFLSCPSRGVWQE